MSPLIKKGITMKLILVLIISTYMALGCSSEVTKQRKFFLKKDGGKINDDDTFASTDAEKSEDISLLNLWPYELDKDGLYEIKMESGEWIGFDRSSDKLLVKKSP